jgi:hypothetical protein
MDRTVTSPGWATISAVTLSVMLHRAGVGELPLLIRPQPAWLDPDEARLAEAAASTELRQLRWLDQRGQIDGEILDRIFLLGRAPVEYGAVFDIDGRPHRLVVVAGGGDAVLASREGTMIHLAVLRDGSPLETLVRQLPEVRTAAISAVNVRRSEARYADAFGHDGQVLANLLGRTLFGAGELYVGVRDRHGHRKISAPVRYQDYAIGRVLVVLSNDHLSVAPASKRLLLDRLNEARSSLCA